MATGLRINDVKRSPASLGQHRRFALMARPASAEHKQHQCFAMSPP